MERTAYWTGALAAFLAELGSLAGLASWGATAPVPTVARVVLALGVPLSAAVLWGLFAAPRAVLPRPATALATKVAVQGGAAAALVVGGHPVLAVVLLAAAGAGALLTRPAAAPARAA